MPNQTYEPAYLHASNVRGGVLIWSLFPQGTEPQEDIEIFILPGESFGGRSFDEWQNVAAGEGKIDAEWLQV